MMYGIYEVIAAVDESYEYLTQDKTRQDDLFHSAQFYMTHIDNVYTGN